jgi:hypothetical protein
MGPRTLVSKEQVRSGEELIHQLTVDGLPIVAALWAKTEYDGQPYLYLVSPTVESEGPLKANRRLVDTFREVEKSWTDPFDQLDPFAIKLIGPSDSLARAVLEHYHRYPDSTPTWHGGAILGSVTIDGAYIYPASMFAPTQPQPTA